MVKLLGKTKAMAVAPGITGWLGATVALPVIASAGGVVLAGGLACFAAHKVKQHFEF